MPVRCLCCACVVFVWYRPSCCRLFACRGLCGVCVGCVCVWCLCGACVWCLCGVCAVVFAWCVRNGLCDVCVVLLWCVLRSVVFL